MHKLTNIGRFALKYPLIQGGMGIGISLGNLAGAVACNGGVGVISMVDIGYQESDFYTNPIQANKRAFVKELQKARELSKGNGMIAVNIMRAVNNFEEYVKFAVKNKIDCIVVGAGLPLTLPELVEGSNVLIAPIISSARALRLIITRWKKNYDKLPDFVVLEGVNAGGHLGFSKDEISSPKHTLQELTSQVSEYLTSNAHTLGNIPFFSAGGISTKKQIQELLDIGADGVQVSTPFILSDECDASLEYKKIIKQSTKDDMRIVKSPVGLMARAIQSPFLEKIKSQNISPKKCIRCISSCNPSQTPYCITDALISAVKGDYQNGLFFSGSNGGNNKKIRPVKEIIEELFI